jgi:acetoacetyl-CoA synthetase
MTGRGEQAVEHRRGEILWEPSPERIASARLTDYEAAVRTRYQIGGAGYDPLWQWSVQHPDEFWTSILDYFEVPFDGEATPVVVGEMPDARWYPRLELSYAETMLRAAKGDEVVVAVDEAGGRPSLSGDELRRQVAAVAGGLRSLGVGVGDRVAAYLPNIPEAIVAMLATASLGAVWSCCAPDFGASATLDRLAQIEPKVLLAADGYRFGGRTYDRRDVVAEIRGGIPGLGSTVVLSRIDESDRLGDLGWAELARAGTPTPPQRVPFGHPLWIVYTSGTTGPPKAIVQGHGGILLEHLKALALHYDLGPESRFFQHTSTGWVMWNLLASGIGTGATIVTYDGAPNYPDPDVLWRLASELQVTDLAVGAAFLVDAMRRSSRPGRDHDLGGLRSLGSTGAALPHEAYRWVFEAVSGDLYLRSNSGGTDVCSGLLGAVPTLPVRSGELQRRPLGVATAVFDPDGREVFGVEGELVVTAPMPSMPLELWNDPDRRRYRDAYFDRWSEVWRHGDWACMFDDGASLVLGRSDATLNRGGVRIGTAEIYRVLEDLPGVTDSVAVDLGGSAADRGLVLFAVAGTGSDPKLLEQDLRAELRRRASPRHVPDLVVWCPALPRTINGKRLEVPIKRVLSGTAAEEAVDPGAIREPELLRTLPDLLDQARRLG